MNLSRQPKEIERLEARISPDKKSLLKNAAELSGQSLTDFVVRVACEEAVRVIEKYQHIHLTVSDRDVFVNALLNPPQPSESLLKAAARYKKDVQSK